MAFPNGEPDMKEGLYDIVVKPRSATTQNGLNCELGNSIDMGWYYWRALNTPGAIAAISIRKQEGCCDCIPRKWRDRVTFTRRNLTDGQPDHLAYSGVVTGILETPSDEAITIFLRTGDVKPFAGFIPAAQDHQYFSEEVDPADPTIIIQPDTRIDAMALFLELWQDAETQEPTGLTLRGDFEDTGILVSSDITVGDALGPELLRLMDLAIDVTVVGNIMYVGSLDIDAIPFDALNPEVHWDDATATIYDDGEDTVSAVTIEGRDGVRATFPVDPADRIHPEVGLIHPVISVNTIETEEEALAYAETYYLLNSPDQGLFVSTAAQQGSVSCEWPIPMSEMVPGRRMGFDTAAAEGLYCRDAKVDTRLQAMRVDGINHAEETVKVVLAPLGTAVTA